MKNPWFCERRSRLQRKVGYRPVILRSAATKNLLMTAEEKQMRLPPLRDQHNRYGDSQYRWAEGPYDTRDGNAGPFSSGLRPLWSGPSCRARRAVGLVLIALFPALFVTPQSLRAGTPDWLRAAAQTPLANYSDNTNAVVLLDEQITSITESGEVRTLYRRAYRILRPEGRRYATVAVAFDKETRLSHLKAWSIPHQGNDYEVKDKDAVETQVFAQLLYEDTREKLLEIPAADPGNVIGYEYEQRRRPSIPQDTWRFQHDIPVRRARFELQMPTGWEYQVFWVNHAAEKPQAAGQNGWVWELNDLPAVESEPSMPAWHSLAGHLGVTYYPRRANAGTTSFGSWPAIARWYAHLAAERRQPNSEIRQKVAELTASAATLLDKIQALAAFVQSDIRYVGIEIGIGGYQPHPAADVFTNRYGDCKDKATLLATLLSVAGIKSIRLRSWPPCLASRASSPTTC